jgi:hypothetical protein
MNKHFAFAVFAFFASASISLASSPFNARAIPDAPSILERADGATPTPVASTETAIVHDSAMVDGPAASSKSVPDQVKLDESSVTPAEPSAPIVTSSPAPVSRSYKPSRKQNGGLFSDLIELERRKNAWLRKNVLGR